MGAVDMQVRGLADITVSCPLSDSLLQRSAARTLQYYDGSTTVPESSREPSLEVGSMQPVSKEDDIWMATIDEEYTKLMSRDASYYASSCLLMSLIYPPAVASAVRTQ